MSTEVVVGKPALKAFAAPGFRHTRVFLLVYYLLFAMWGVRSAWPTVPSRLDIMVPLALSLRDRQLLGDCRRSRSWPSYSSLVAAMVFLGRGVAGARLCDLESRLARGRIRGPARRAGISVGYSLHECRSPFLSSVCGGPSRENGELSNGSDSGMNRSM